MTQRSILEWLAARARARRGERGFTVIELMVALTVFALLLAGIGLVYQSTITVAGQSRYRSVAANLASQQMDAIRKTANENFSALPTSGRVTSSQTVDGIPYTIYQDAEWVTQDATVGACDG